MVYLKTHLDYITKVFSFLETMKWQSKKELDYLDWKTVLKLKQLGLLNTDLGVKLIEQILACKWILIDYLLTLNLKQIEPIY